VTRYLSLAEYFWPAEQVIGTAAEVLEKVSPQRATRRASRLDVIDRR
jgi:hypothetical protein